MVSISVLVKFSIKVWFWVSDILLSIITFYFISVYNYSYP